MVVSGITSYITAAYRKALDEFYYIDSSSLPTIESSGWNKQKQKQSLCMQHKKMGFFGELP